MFVKGTRSAKRIIAHWRRAYHLRVRRSLVRQQSSESWVVFTNFFIKPGWVEWTCMAKSTGAEPVSMRNHIEFDKFVPSNDVIAGVLATFCGHAYTAVYLDLALHEAVVASIAQFTGAHVVVRRIMPGDACRPHAGSAALCFSGGLDSLAAYCLMPADTNLISLDFGGWFDRETRFFEQFPTHVVRTDVRRNAERGGARSNWIRTPGSSWVSALCCIVTFSNSTRSFLGAF